MRLFPQRFPIVSPFFVVEFTLIKYNLVKIFFLSLRLQRCPSYRGVAVPEPRNTRYRGRVPTAKLTFIDIYNFNDRTSCNTFIHGNLA